MSKHQPALLGGLFIGVLSVLPVVNAANCCCLWVIVGGVLVVYLQQQKKVTPVETGEAVVGGLIAGVIGAVISAMGIMLISGIGGPMAADSVRQALEQNSQVTPEMRDNIMKWVNGPNLGILIMCMSLPVYAVFAMLGSLLGLAFFRKKVPPQTQPPPMVQG
jgi:hypothetical protein